MKYTFGGESVTTYAEYIDLDAGSTLVAEPGGTYSVGQAAGVSRPDEDGALRPVELPMPPDDRWKPAAKSALTAAEKAAKEQQAASRPADDSEGTAG